MTTTVPQQLDLFDYDGSLDDVFEHLCYRLFNAPLQRYPFPHFFASNVFPSDFYAHFRASLPPASSYKTKTGDDGCSMYHGRLFAPTENLPLRDHFLSPLFIKRVVQFFQPYFPEVTGKVTSELRLIRDGQDYHIGPHTDASWKLLSLLFYLPSYMTERGDLGTSIYVPRDPTFRCSGGPHYAFSDFHLLHTFPFAANACLGFLKTDHSFHGVEPITIPYQRDVLLWNLYSVPGKTGD